MLRLSPCSEPPPSPIKLSLHENRHIPRLDDGKKSKGQAVPIIPQTLIPQKAQSCAARKYNEEGHDSVAYKGHHISGSFLPTLDKRKRIMPLAGRKDSDSNRLTRIASYGFLPSDVHKVENANTGSSWSIPVGMQRIQRKPVQGLPVLRPHEYGRSGVMITVAPSTQQGCPLMSIRTLRNTRSSNH